MSVFTRIHGVPSYDTCARVFVSFDLVEFREGFLRWVEGIKTAVTDHIASDGKTHSALLRQ